MYYDYTSFLPYTTLFPEDAAQLSWCIESSASVGFQPTISWVPSFFAFDNTTEQSVVGFSSRGPASIGTSLIGDYLKPDLIAPGQNILAAWNPYDEAWAPGETFISIEGTSMSTPHAAGAMVLLKGAYPDWSPANIHAALASTATLPVNVLSEQNGDLVTSSVFDRGSGAIDVLAAYNAGLLFDYSAEDFVSQPLWTVNRASVHFGSFVTTSSVSRTLRSATFGTSTWNFYVNPAQSESSSCASYVVDPAAAVLNEGDIVNLTLTIDISSPACQADQVFEGTFEAVQTDGPGRVHIAYVAIKDAYQADTNLIDLPSVFSQNVPVKLQFTEPYAPNDVLFYQPLPLTEFFDPQFSYPYYGVDSGTVIGFTVDFGTPFIGFVSSDIFNEQPDIGLALFYGADPDSAVEVASSDVFGSSEERIEYVVPGESAGVYWLLVFNNLPPVGQARLLVEYVVINNPPSSVPFQNDSNPLTAYLAWDPSTIPLGASTYGAVQVAVDDWSYYEWWLVTVVGLEDIVEWSGASFPAGVPSFINLTVTPPPGFDGERWVITDHLNGLTPDPSRLPPSTHVNDNALSWTVTVSGTTPFTFLYFAQPSQSALPGTTGTNVVTVVRPNGSTATQSFDYTVAGICGNGECELTEDASNCAFDCGDCGECHQESSGVPDAEFNFFFQGLIPAAGGNAKRR